MAIPKQSNCVCEKPRTAFAGNTDCPSLKSSAKHLPVRYGWMRKTASLPATMSTVPMCGRQWSSAEPPTINTVSTDTYAVITGTMTQNAITIKADVPPYLLGLDPTLYFDRSHLSKYILQLAKIKKLGKALDKIEQNDIMNKSPVEGLICECAGIGRQASLRCLCSIGRVGSSPITRTIPLLR